MATICFLFNLILSVSCLSVERQLMTARANQTTGLTNGKAVNWAQDDSQEVEFSPFRALSLRQLTFPFCC